MQYIRVYVYKYPFLSSLYKHNTFSIIYHHNYYYLPKMSTESSYNLQQSLYSLYRDYYHCGNCTLLRQTDFDHGTYQIKKSGLYVLCEDIVFNPDPEYLETSTAYTENKAYAMGYFAAITVECDDVVIDLQGCTIRQSYEHYFTQRFFNIIELGSSPFITSQGPALVNQSVGDYPYVSANHCLIINGTIGLSSHGGVHGNNNTGILLQKLSVVDFESCGVQLNGVCNAFIDCVTVTGITIAPVRSTTFTMLMHLKALQKQVVDGTGSASIDVVLADTTTSKTISRDTVITNLNAMAEALKCPFKEADIAHLATSTPPSTTMALRTIWEAIQLIDGTCADGVDNVPAEVSRFVSPVSVDKKSGATIAPPDGSAMYGFLIHESGVAIAELGDGCAQNGGVCCPMQKNTQKCCRGSRDVTINNCSVSNIDLRAQETVGIFKTAFVRDLTSAVLDIVTIQPESYLEQARVLVNSTNTTPWGVAIQRLLMFSRTEYTYATFITECSDVSFKYNIDIMAHVSKGAFGLRIEDTTGLCVENVVVKDLQNISEVMYPRIEYQLPKSAIVDTFITSPIDQTSDYAYGGADVRGIFIGNCRGYMLTQLTLANICCKQGICNGVDIAQSHNGHIHVLQTSKLSGLITDAVHVHNNCDVLHLRDIHNDTKNIETYRTLLERVLKVVDNVDDASTESQYQEAFGQLSTLLRTPSTDNNILAFESPSSIAQLRLC